MRTEDDCFTTRVCEGFISCHPKLSEELDIGSRMGSKEGIWNSKRGAGFELLGAYDSEPHPKLRV